MRKLLFFHAPWCPPCRFYEKQFIKPLEALAEVGQIAAVDAQSDPFTAEKYQVDKLPTVVFLDGESPVRSTTGAININEVAEWLKGEG